MKTEDIRPEALLKENWRLYYEDVAVMMEGREGFVAVHCPACGLDYPITGFTKDGFEHVICGECDTLYISPRPTFEMLMEFYKGASSIKHWNDVIFPTTEEARRSEMFGPKMWHVLKARERFDVQPWKFADIGAGFGTFCQEIKRSGHFGEVIAVEPSPELAESCRERGLEVLEGAIEEVDLVDVSVMTALELMEHLFDPRSFLKGCHKALCAGGLLILTTPNIKGFDLVQLGETSENVGGPNHLQFFNPRSIRGILDGAGFEVLELTTPGKLDVEIVRRAVQRGKHVLEPFLSDMLMRGQEDHGEPFQKFLQENLLSSHMRVVARKA